MTVSLADLPDLARALCAPAATATDVAARLGAAEDPTGWGEQLTVDAPTLASVRLATVLCDAPLARPSLVWLYLTTPIARRDVVAGFGLGLRRWAEDDQLETLHDVPGAPCTLIARGDEDTVDELVLRRDD